MFTIFATTESMKEMISFTQAKPILAGLVLIILTLLVIVIYLVNTWQPKSFTETKKSSRASKKKTAKK